MKRILLLYHFFYPDTVVSARIFSDLAAELSRQGYDVTAFCCNKLIRGEETLTNFEEWRQVKIHRFSRGNFNQGSNFGRLFNSGILQLKWLRAFWSRRREFDAVIIGTDPQFAYMMFPLIRLINRKMINIHWAFDLYPDVILADSPRWMRFLASFTKPLAYLSYRYVDVMADIGGCMQQKLANYAHRATRITLTPWALVEPRQIPAPNAEIRKQLFGNAKIGILYSGTVGHAHDITPFIRLARICREQNLDIGFCFAGYGNQYQQQIAQLTPEDGNITLVGFASEAELELRLAAADIHLISLRDNWDGLVVPSKFFGALAIGRPVIFCGSAQSCIKQWIDQYQLGWYLQRGNESAMARQLAEYADDAERKIAIQQRVFDCYHQHFSKSKVISGWSKVMNEI